MNLQTSEIIWDGKRDNGQLPAVGVYYYRLELSDKYGATAYSSGSLSLIR
jgi:hypothetical protein